MIAIQSARPRLKRAAHLLLVQPAMTSRTAVHTLLHEPSSMGLWMRSLLPGRSALVDQIPWMPFKAQAWLESYLTRDMRVFEYGSGGSTLFLSQRVGSLVSVEHDRAWHSLVSGELTRLGMKNCEYVLMESEIAYDGNTPAYGPNSFTSTKFPELSFEAYVRTIDGYADDGFDLVIVDGRARASCVASALSKVRPGGYLMLDDTYRGRYEEAMALLSSYERRDFTGAGPYDGVMKQTTVWQIENERVL